MGQLSKFFGLAFSALLPLVNPLGDALVFLSLVGSASPAVYRSLARKIAFSTTIFLIAIEAAGTLILRFFGISLPVVQVSGGRPLMANQKKNPTRKRSRLTWMAQACDPSNKKFFTHSRFRSPPVRAV